MTMRVLVPSYIILIAISWLLITSCNKESQCIEFENSDDILLSAIESNPCIDGERLVILKAEYNGTRPYNSSWEWEIDGISKGDNNIIQVVGDEAMTGYIKFKNNLTGCFIYKSLEIPAGEPSGGVIGNMVWEESSPGGTEAFDDADYRMYNIEVRLLSADNKSIIARDTTDYSGRYLFDALSAGDYIIHIIKPSQMTFVAQGACPDEFLDSDVNADGYSDVISLGACEVRLDIDAGLY